MAKTAKTAAKNMQAKAKALLVDFARDTPHEALQGRYSFCERDRWHGRKLGVLDGWYSHGPWQIRIKGGRPVEAVRDDQADRPKATRI